MALEDEVKKRVDNQLLIELTNDSGSTSTSVDDTILTTISGDIEEEFELLAKEKFDITNNVHISICVSAVVGRLYEYKGTYSPVGTQLYETFQQRAQQIAQGNLAGPSSNSNYDQKDERESTDEKFRFTKSFWNDFRPTRRLHKKDNLDGS